MGCLVTKHEPNLHFSYREAEALHMEEEDDLDDDNDGRNGRNSGQSSSLSSILQSG